MQIFRTSSLDVLSRVQYESTRDSFDCGDEFSPEHWIRVCELLNESEGVVGPADAAYSAGDVDVTKKPVSEVEAAATDQHLARHVV